MDDNEKKLRRQARENLKNYHARKSEYDKAGEVLLKKAEEDIAERAKRSSDESKALAKEVASGLVGMAVGRVAIISPWDAPRREIKCCVCGGSPGEYFYMPDDRWYGSCCKALFGATKEEVEEERKALCH